MFNNFSNFGTTEGCSLQIDASGAPTSFELQVAAIALLVEAANSSGSMGEEELPRVIGGAFSAFGLNEHDAALLLEISEFLLRDRNKINELVSAVEEHFTEVQKAELLILVWRVIAADGVAEVKEAQFAAFLRKKLGLTLEQAVLAQSIASSSAEEISSLNNGSKTVNSEIE